jgi:hypothetical protein
LEERFQIKLSAGGMPGFDIPGHDHTLKLIKAETRTQVD